ncbi:hypothetical protein QQZ08_001348 [Neonectria magnoliae]|uniref:ABC transmembrane type-1 domain-containing protein n=1 Tax=Neonectria magnoliae TaxID=2732573 RepID=A0ABR1IEJ7_9HYPO
MAMVNLVLGEFIPVIADYSSGKSSPQDFRCAGSFAERILSNARTIHAFGIRSRLVDEFDKCLQTVRSLGNTKSPVYGLLFSGEYCVVYAGFGLTFWQGIKMLANNEVDQPGDVFIVMLMSVVVAAGSLTAMTVDLIDFTVLHLQLQSCSG